MMTKVIFGRVVAQHYHDINPMRTGVNRGGEGGRQEPGPRPTRTGDEDYELAWSRSSIRIFPKRGPERTSANEDLWRLTRTGTRTGINEDWGNPVGDHANQANGEIRAGA